MADTDAREPDGTEEASTANAGAAQEPSRLETATDVELPDFDELQKNISETRKQAGPDFPDVAEDDPSVLELEEDEEIGPTDPS